MGRYVLRVGVYGSVLSQATRLDRFADYTVTPSFERDIDGRLNHDGFNILAPFDLHGVSSFQRLC